MRKLSAAFVSLVVLGSVGVASADDKAWVAAKANLPDNANTTFAIAADVQALSKTGAWAAVLPKVMDNADFKKGLEIVNKACKVDAMKVITSVVIAGSSITDKGVAYISVPGFGTKKAVECLTAVGAEVTKGGKEKMVVKQDGDVVELSDGKQSIYVGFVGEVAVVALKEMPDKKALQGWMGGKGAFAKGTLGKALAKANASAAVFGGSIEKDKLKESTMGATDFVGSVTYASSSYSAEVHASYANATDAKSVVGVATTGIAQIKKNPPFPSLAGLLSSITVSQNGSEMVIKGSIADKDVTDLIKNVLPKM